jgi:hypothetical protein
VCDRLIRDGVLIAVGLALGRLQAVFLTETIDAQVHVDPGQQSALVVESAEFVWFHQPGGAKNGKGDKQGKWGSRKKNGHGDEKQGLGDVKQNDQQDAKPVAFRVAEVSMNIPRGSLVGIVGPVGCGKSSLLLGLLGEMPQTRGTVSFGGKTAYCSQMAWIQNATLVSTWISLDHLLVSHTAIEGQCRFWSTVGRGAVLERNSRCFARGRLGDAP